MSEVDEWLESLGLGHYAGAFADNDIGWDVVPELDHEILKEIGVRSAGHRLQIMKAAKALEVPWEGEAAVSAQPDSPARPASTGAAERRQLTVMFCDLVGSTALADGMDPEDYREVLVAYQSAAVKAIERYEGYIARYMGDGLLVYFGYPQAHEEDVERAVHAGLGIVESVSALTPRDGVTLRVRIGIATGRVVVGDIVGEGASEERAVLGETPNLAARLQGVAEPDQIVISDATRRLVEGRFELRSLGELSLKGIADPVPAHAVAGAKAVSRFEGSRVAGLTPLVGRAEELGMLTRRWELAAGGEGQVVTLGGEPGIGKSRIVEEFRQRVASGARVVQYQCSPYYVDAAFHPVIEQLERDLAFEPHEEPRSRVAKIDALLASTAEDSDESAKRVALLASLLSLPADAYPTLDLTPQVRKTHTIALLAGVLGRLARREPLLVVLEDAHWIDPSTRELFDLVVADADSQALLLIVTHRPEFELPWTARGHVTQMSMNRLGRDDGASLVAWVASRARLTDVLARQIAEKTDGIPLFLEELTKSLLESGGLAVSEDDRGLEDALSALDVPSTLHDLLMARLDRLGPVKEIAQIAAVLGREFAYASLASLAGLEEDALDAGLSRLVETGLLGRRATGPNGAFYFRHALMRDVAYESLLLARRKSLHAKAAALVRAAEPKNHTLLASHLQRAETWAEAFDQFRLAGHNAERGYAMSEAVRLYEQALVMGERAGEEVAAERVAAILKATAGVLFAQGRFEDSYEFADRMRVLARQCGDASAEGSALLAMASARMWMEDFDGALEYAAEAKAVAERAGVLGPDAGGMMISGHVLALRGQVDEAAPELDRCIEIGLARGDYTYVPPACFMSANLENWAGNYDAAIAIADRGRAIAREEQQTAGWLRCNWTHANALTGKGAYDEAFDGLREGLALGEKMEDISFIPRYLNTLGWFYNEVHAFEQAQEYSRRAAEMVRDDSHAVGVERWMFAMLNWADARLAVGDRAGAKEILDEAYGALESPRDFEWMRWRYAIHLCASMAEYWIAAGDPAKAAGWVEPCLKGATEKNSRKYVAMGRRVAGLIALDGRDLDAAELAFREAGTIAEQIGHPNERWKAQAALASLYERSGDRNRSVHFLNDARAVLSATALSIADTALRSVYAGAGPALAVREGELIW